LESAADALHTDTPVSGSAVVQRRAIARGGVPTLRPTMLWLSRLRFTATGRRSNHARRHLCSAQAEARCQDTIFALSTAPGLAAIAVFRLSGPRVAEAAGRLLQRRGLGKTAQQRTALPRARRAVVRRLVHPHSGELLDEALTLWFPGPHSFTGEDMLELHVHGSRAVVEAVHDALAAVAEEERHPAGVLRMAHAGEFSLRAFENGKMDLTQAEGLSDLLAAETVVQRRQAVAQALGEEGT
jgi:tRNA modification GTPase